MDTSPLRIAFLAALFALSVLVNGCGGAAGGTTAAAAPAPAVASSPAPHAVAVHVTERASHLDNPWGMAFLPDGRMLVTERGGTLKLLQPSGAVLGTVSGVPAVAFEGQGGLLDVTIDPGYQQNHRIYLSYSERDARDATLMGTAVARAVLDPQTRSLASLTVIYRQTPKVASNLQFGSRLVFDRTGNLFVTLGDHFVNRQNAQDLTRGDGKVARITTDGAPAPGNPVWRQPGAQPHLYSFGHRNPQGAALNPATGELWISEHGARGGDEINRIQPGRNYGWPITSFSQEYGTHTPVAPTSLPDTEPPAWVWVEIDGSAWPGDGAAKSSIAPCGMTFYNSDAVPQWKGNLFVGALAGTALWRLTLDGNTITRQERLLSERHERMRDVVQGPDGALYLLTDDGKMLRYGA
jgi:glucose/arabinose dehydrogenase